MESDSEETQEVEAETLPLRSGRDALPTAPPTWAQKLLARETIAERATARAASAVGRVLLGRYRLVRLLAAGGMADVFEAEHLALGQAVAVKIVAAALALHPEVEARFRREARAAARIRSEHVATVLDVGEDPELGLFLVQELLRGEDLASLLLRRGRLPAHLACGIAHQAAMALEKAHAVGVIHRDLKPGNVFLTAGDDGALQVKLVDFGIAKVLEESETHPITSAGTVIGTPQYMSPEQARGEADVDGRSDVYSLGAVLYEALSARAPYAGEGPPEELLLRVVREPVVPLETLQPDVPPEVTGLVGQLMARDRVERPASASEARARLAAIYPDLGRPRLALVPSIALGAPPARPSVAERLPPLRPLPSERPVELGPRSLAPPRGDRRLFGAAYAILGLLLAVNVGLVVLNARRATDAAAATAATPAPAEVSAARPDAGTDASPAAPASEPATEETLDR